MLSQRQNYFFWRLKFSSSEVLEIGFFVTYPNTFPLIMHSMIDGCHMKGHNQVIDMKTWLFEVH